MKTIYVVYVKSSDIELAQAFIMRSEAEDFASAWNRYAAIYELQVKV